MKKSFWLLAMLVALPVFAMAQPSLKLPGEFVHSVYFWLKNPDSESDKAEFLEALETFIKSYLENMKKVTY